MNNEPTVATIIVNWNGLEDTLECLQSISHCIYPNHHTIVVDNGSTDGSLATIREAWPHVVTLDAGENLGFTGGNNIGIQHALDMGVDYVFLLNNDTVIAPDLISVLVSEAERATDIGVVGPTIYYHAQPEAIWTVGGGIDWRTGNTWMMGLNEIDEGQFGSEARPVDFVSGCAMLIKREVIEKVGMFDTSFYMYYEETEWCVRISKAGYRILHAPYGMVWHKIAIEDRAASPRVHYYMTRNRLLFLWRSRAGVRAWAHTLFAEYLRTLLSWTLRPKWRNKKPQRKAMLQAIWDFARGHLGKANTAIL